MKPLKKVGRELAWVTMGQAVAASGSLIGVLLLTRSLSPAVYGEVALGMTLVTLIQQLLFGPMGAALLRYFASAQENQQTASFLRGVTQLFVYTTLLIVLAGIIVIGILAVAKNTALMTISLSSLLLALVLGYVSAFDSIQNAARQRAVVAWHQGVGEWLRYLTAVLLINLFGISSGLVLIGYSLATGLKLFSQFFFFNQQFSLATDSPSEEISLWVQQIVRYAWPFGLWGFFYWMSTASERWSLQILASNREVGLYALLYQLGYYPVLLLSTSSMQLFAPILFGQAGVDSDSPRMKQAYHWNNRLLMGTLLAAVLGTLTAFLTHEFLFEIFVAREYRSVSYLLPWVVLAGGLFSAGQVATMKIMIRTDSQALLIPKIMTSVVSVGLNFLGVYLGGLGGLVAALVISSAFYLGWMVWKTSR